MLTKPLYLLHAEGAVVLMVSFAAYHELNGNWLLFYFISLARPVYAWIPRERPYRRSALQPGPHLRWPAPTRRGRRVRALAHGVAIHSDLDSPHRLGSRTRLRPKIPDIFQRHPSATPNANRTVTGRSGTQTFGMARKAPDPQNG